MKKLKNKIDDKSAVVGIIGLGYVGVPLAMAFAGAGFKVLGFDVQQKRVDLVNRGQSYKSGADAQRACPAWSIIPSRYTCKLSMPLRAASKVIFL